MQNDQTQCSHDHLMLHDGWLWCTDCEDVYGEYLGYVPTGKILLSMDEGEATATPLDRGHPSVPDWVPETVTRQVEVPERDKPYQHLLPPGRHYERVEVVPPPLPPSIKVRDLFHLISNQYMTSPTSWEFPDDAEVMIWDDVSPDGWMPATSVEIVEGKLHIS